MSITSIIGRIGPFRSSLSSIPPADISGQMSLERMELAWRQSVRTLPGMFAAAMGALWIWSDAGQLMHGALWIMACLLQAMLTWLAARRFLRLDDAQRRLRYQTFWRANTLGGVLHGLLCMVFAFSVVPVVDASAKASVSVVLLVLGGWLTSTGSLLRAGFAFSILLPSAALLLIWWPTDVSRIPAAMIVSLFGMALLWMRREQELLLRRSVVTGMRNALLMREAIQRSQLIESINKKKTEIIAAASHDLRQPVHALGLLVQRLRPNLPEADQIVLFHQVRSRVAVISEMLAGLLDLSRFDSGSYQVRLERVRLQDLVDEVLGLFEEKAFRKQLKLRHCLENVDVETDAVLLKQIIYNLISNAIKYTPSGEVMVLGTRDDRGRFLLTVRDTGVGIPRGHIEEVFMEYYRLPRHRNGGEDGLGIGLALVRRAAALLGYRVSLKSREGRGSSFILKIPAERVTLHRMVEVAQADTIPGDLDGNANHLVLLLENDEVAHDAMVRLVTDWGYRVISSTNGELMMERLRQNPSVRPDLIVSDMHLGNERDGLEYIELVRGFLGLSDLPGLVVTGDLGRELQARATRHNIRILYKPLQPRMLRTAMRAALGA